MRIRIARGERRAFLRSVKLPRRVRPGRHVRARVTLRRVRGGIVHRRYRVRIPGHLRRGIRSLRFTGSDVDIAEDGLLGTIIIGDEADDGAGEPGPRSLAALADRIRGRARFDGVRIRAAGTPSRAFRDPEFRISGRTTAVVRVVRRRR